MSATPSQITRKIIDAFTKDGIKESFRRMYIYKTIRPGTLVGRDQFGNEFYEAAGESMHLRQRWVETAGKKSDVNATKISPEWHSWMTRVTDEPPTKIPLEHPPYLLKFQPTTLSKMAQNANFVPCHYYNKPVDITPVSYPKVKYTAWEPTPPPKKPVPVVEHAPERQELFFV